MSSETLLGFYVMQFVISICILTLSVKMVLQSLDSGIWQNFEVVEIFVLLYVICALVTAVWTDCINEDVFAHLIQLEYIGRPKRGIRTFLKYAFCHPGEVFVRSRDKTMQTK